MYLIWGLKLWKSLKVNWKNERWISFSRSLRGASSYSGSWSSTLNDFCCHQYCHTPLIFVLPNLNCVRFHALLLPFSSPFWLPALVVFPLFVFPPFFPALLLSSLLVVHSSYCLRNDLVKPKDFFFQTSCYTLLRKEEKFDLGRFARVESVNQHQVSECEGIVCYVLAPLLSSLGSRF